MIKILKSIKKKKNKFSRFPRKTLKVVEKKKYSNLLNILKKGLKTKKRKTRLAGRNFYVISMKKILSFQRQYSFFRLRYSSSIPFKVAINKNSYIFINKRKYRNTILKRSLIKKLIRLNFFNKSYDFGRRKSVVYKLRMNNAKALKLFMRVKKIFLYFRLLTFELYFTKYFLR
jgi:hypothetical protein